jgi:2-phosphosulfolactate phosphatase
LGEAEARAAARAFPEGGCVLSGELFAETIDGFVAPTPLALLEHGVGDRALIYSTTNGTVALSQSSAAQHVYAGALLNARSIVEHIALHHPEATVLLVCSGSMGNPNLEDMYGAGYFVELIARELGETRDLSDAAWAARALYRSEPAESLLLRGRVGQLMQERGLIEEVKYAARQSTLQVVPKLIDGRLQTVASA